MTDPKLSKVDLERLVPILWKYMEAGVLEDVKATHERSGWTEEYTAAIRILRDAYKRMPK